MADPFRQYIPTPAQMEALGAAFERVGHAAREAADNMVEAFAAAARQMARWERAEARREAQWRRKQQKDILRQQLDRDTSYFGRKRRWRRARGRRIEARQNSPYVGGRIWLASARSGFRSHPLPKVMMLDEVDSFPTGELTVEQWAAAHRTMQGQKGEAHEADQDGR